jgi:hypothetical protein
MYSLAASGAAAGIWKPCTGFFDRADFGPLLRRQMDRIAAHDF